MEGSTDQLCASPAGSGSALPACAHALLAGCAQRGASRGGIREHPAVVPASRRCGSLLCEDSARLRFTLRIHLSP